MACLGKKGYSVLVGKLMEREHLNTLRHKYENYIAAISTTIYAKYLSN
jgi:hypothetical protein